MKLTHLKVFYIKSATHMTWLKNALMYFTEKFGVNNYNK